MEPAIAAVYAEAEADSGSGKTQPKPRAANRGSLSAHRPRAEEIIEPESPICSCGGCLHCIGEDITERLDVIPAQFRVCTYGVSPDCRPRRLSRMCWFPDMPIICLSIAKLRSRADRASILTVRRCPIGLAGQRSNYE